MGDGVAYYHIVDSREFESDKEIQERCYSKNGSYFTITKVDDEIQREPRRTKQRVRRNVG